MFPPLWNALKPVLRDEMHMITRGFQLVLLWIFIYQWDVTSPTFVSPVCGPESLGVGMARVGQPTQKVAQVQTVDVCVCVGRAGMTLSFLFFFACEDLLRKIKRPFERCD
jgi:hypothetical protein